MFTVGLHRPYTTVVALQLSETITFSACFQLYNAYVETQDQLLLEKLENKRINKYLDEIVKEVEAKAPILKRQREEYERAQKAVASLSAKLEQAMKVGSVSELELWAWLLTKHLSLGSFLIRIRVFVPEKLESLYCSLTMTKFHFHSAQL